MTRLSELKKEIPRLVLMHRKKSGLSRDRLAKLAGVGKTAIFDLEHGKMTVQLDTLIRILETLNMEIRFSSQLLRALDEKQK
jgi:DNA-binding XRE family transcriptional regulator